MRWLKGFELPTAEDATSLKSFLSCSCLFAFGCDSAPGAGSVPVPAGLSVSIGRRRRARRHCKAFHLASSLSETPLSVTASGNSAACSNALLALAGFPAVCKRGCDSGPSARSPHGCCRFGDCTNCSTYLPRISTSTLTASPT